MDNEIIEIEGEVTKIIRFDNGYTILTVTPPKKQPKILVGSMPSFAVGMNVKAKTTQIEHQKYGIQYKVTEIEETGFNATDALIEYLSGTFFGIGHSLARKIVDKFGIKTMDVLDKEPERVAEIDGIGKVRKEEFINGWHEQREAHKTMTTLMGMGMTLNIAMKAHNHFKPNTIATVKENPYCLIDIPGVGFHKADEVALHMGIAKDSPFRVKAGILYTLDNKLFSAGHCYVQLSEVIAETTTLLGNAVNHFQVNDVIKEMSSNGTIVIEEDKVYLSSVYSAEKEVADHLKAIVNYPNVPLYSSIEDVKQVMSKHGIMSQMKLADEQFEAILSALNSRVTIITGGPGTGKALRNSTLIPTPNGLCQMRNLKVGDYIFGSNGKPTKILGVYPQGIKSVYNVNFDDNTSVGCCKEHLWNVQNKRDRTKETFHTYNTETIIDKLQGGDRMRRLYIPLVNPIDLPNKNLQIDPYLLGLLIGDGSITESVGITTADPEIIDSINSILPNNLTCKLTAKKSITYRITNRSGRSKRGSNQIINSLRFYNLFGCKSINKFIPNDYLFSSIEQRVALLQGLMDTDGTVNEKSATNTSYSTISLQLAKDIQFLAQSLGCKAILKVKKGKYKGDVHYSYRVTIAPNSTIKLFRLNRKNDIFKYHTKYKPMKTIKSVIYSHDEECTCIYVDAEDHLFCANDFTVTHNTTLTKATCALLKRNGIDYELCSPTGRAAKRLTEATGDEAKTIHRLLGFSQGKFEHNAENPLPTRCVLVDEFSMVDILLFRYLLAALQPDTRLILVGDSNQLPSVGPGNVLHDLIESEVIPVVCLKAIFRQEKGSTITHVAHQILRGEIPQLESPAKSKGKKCMLVAADNKDVLMDYIVSLISVHLPNAGIKQEDIQVLTPMRERGLGINDLNPVLQAVLNPPHPQKPEINSGFRILRVGDKVMQVRNDYDKGTFNGDVGIISGINKQDTGSFIFVKYPDVDELVEYPQCDWDDLQLAFSMTIHKSQGSEYPVVILVLHSSHYNMLQRNLFYTGLTRAKKMCIIAGTQSAIETAVNNNKEQKRNTTLKQRLLQEKTL